MARGPVPQPNRCCFVRLGQGQARLGAGMKHAQPVLPPKPPVVGKSAGRIPEIRSDSKKLRNGYRRVPQAAMPAPSEDLDADQAGTSRFKAFKAFLAFKAFKATKVSIFRLRPSGHWDRPQIQLGDLSAKKSQKHILCCCFRNRLSRIGTCARNTALCLPGLGGS